MIQVKYPDWVEAQIQLIDEQIERMYKEAEEYIHQNPDLLGFTNYKEMQRVQRNLYERTRPLVDEKVRLIMNSHPTYTISQDDWTAYAISARGDKDGSNAT